MTAVIFSAHPQGPQTSSLSAGRAGDVLVPHPARGQPTTAPAGIQRQIGSDRTSVVLSPRWPMRNCTFLASASSWGLFSHGTSRGACVLLEEGGAPTELTVG